MKYYVKDKKGKDVKGEDGRNLIVNEVDKKLLQNNLQPHPYIYELVIADHMVHQIKRRVGDSFSVKAIKSSLRRADGDIDEAVRILRIYEN